jgi:hypothetical protein
MKSFSSDTSDLIRVWVEFESLGVVNTICEFNKDDPHIFCHREEGFLPCFQIPFFSAIFNLADLDHRLTQLGYLCPKLGLDIALTIVSILDHIMHEACLDSSYIRADIHQVDRRIHGVDDVLFSAESEHSLMRMLGKLKSLLY